MVFEKDIFSRSQLLLGKDAMDRIATKQVILFGVGGVGSWCAESLVRSGIRRLTIVDSDIVCPSNVNRQLMATTQTIGQVKVDALRDRLLAINPNAEITAIHDVFNEETADNFDIGSYDYVVDAIDSLKDKALLILMATKSDVRLFSSMGAALKMDPTRIRISEFWKVHGDPLARALRNRFKRSGQFPSKKFKCVFSDELLENKENVVYSGSETVVKSANGSLVHITAMFGLMLASLVIQDAINE